MHRVRPASAADRSRTLAVIAAAFAADPVIRWFFPTDATYPARAESFFGFLFDLRLAVDGAWVTEDGEAAALWSPPGVVDAPGLPAGWCLHREPSVG